MPLIPGKIKTIATPNKAQDRKIYKFIKNLLKNTDRLNMFTRYQNIILAFIIPLIGSIFFTSCTGVTSQRNAILSSLNDVNLQLSTEEPNQVEEQPGLDQPDEFNYFPYDIQLDTIAYTTCDNPNDFTLKVGSYFSRSGVRLSDYFLTEQENLDNTALKNLIKSSTKHAARPRLVFAKVSKVLTQFFKASDHLFDIQLEDYIDELIATGAERLQRLDGNMIEAIIKSNPLNPAVLWSRSTKLTLSYKNREGQSIQRAPDEASRNFYGRIYDLNFREKLKDRYILNSLTERKRPVETPQPDWNCSADLQFEIRKSHKQAYDAETFYDAQNAAYKAKYTTVEAALAAPDEDQRIPEDEPICPNSNDGGNLVNIARQILGTDWNINISEGCVSPVHSTVRCYSPEHDPGPTVIPVISYQSNCTNTKSKVCPHLLSICIRKN